MSQIERGEANEQGEEEEEEQEEQESEDATEEVKLPEPRKKVYRREPKRGGVVVERDNRKESVGQRACKITFALLVLATIITLVVLATGDRPLAVVIQNAMSSSGDLVVGWYEAPSNETDGMGDQILQPTTTPMPTTFIWVVTPAPPPTKKPQAGVVTPSATMNFGNYTYEFFKHPWVLDTAIEICRRRQGLLVFIDTDEEMVQIRDWIRFNVTDKLPYWRAGLYWSGGISNKVFPLEPNFDWSWRGRANRTRYQNFCPNHTAEYIKKYWDANPDKHTLTVVMDFNRKHHMDPTMGCWKLLYPMVEEYREEHKDLAGLPFICKKGANALASRTLITKADEEEDNTGE